MYEFDCVRPRDLAEAFAVLARGGAEAAVLAGGTDLCVVMRSGARKPRVVVAIAGIPELKLCEVTDGAVRLGAALTHAEIAQHPRLAQVEALAQAARAVGSPQIRNVGTVGGNVANASPAGDLYPPLLALDAKVVLASAASRREVALDDFVTGPGTTSLAPGEIVSEVGFTHPPGKFHSGFAKVGLRNAVAISVANCAVVATAAAGKFGDVRLACGAVAPRPIRLRKAEALLSGERLTTELVEEVSRAASRECDPITDIRATADYRRQVVGALVARLVRAAWRDLTGAGLAQA